MQRYLLVHVGHSKVGDFKHAVVRDQNVGRFNVEVEKAGEMDMRQSRCSLIKQVF